MSAAQSAWPTEALELSALALPTVGAARRHLGGLPVSGGRVSTASGGPGQGPELAVLATALGSTWRACAGGYVAAPVAAGVADTPEHDGASLAPPPSWPYL